MQPHSRLAAAVVSVIAAAVLACQSNEPTAPLNTIPTAMNAAQGSSKGQEAQCDTVGIFATVTDINVGGTTQLSAQPYGNHAKPLDKATFTWSSLTPAVAAVSSTGLVTGVSPGWAIIRATCSATPGLGDVQINVH